MALVTLIEALPRAAGGGDQVPVRAAGGGSRAYSGHRGFTDWIAGVEGPPKFSASIGFSEAGWTGFSRPTSAVMRIGCDTNGPRLSYLGGLFWNGAPVEVYTGDDEGGAGFALRIRGVVSGIATNGAYVELTIGDLSRDIDKPICPNTFAGTGGIEGTTDATGRIKRRSWGYVFNVEGRSLDPAYNVYEFGDPAHPMQEFVAVKDKGYAGPTTFLDWQGSIDATLAALRASAPPSGGSVVAPSIACVKWWTVPAGPLTADIRGDATGGYLAAPAQIVAKLLSEFSATSITNMSDATGFRPYDSGLHVADADTTVSEAIDKTLLGVSLLWTVAPDASVTIREFTWSGTPVATLRSQTIKRDAVYPPLRNRKIAYQANNRIHSDGEISAALLTANDVAYLDGTPIEVLKPGEAGANVTEDRTAAAIAGQGELATVDSVAFDSSQLLETSGGAPAALDDFKTQLGVASAISGQGALATASDVTDQATSDISVTQSNTTGSISVQAGALMASVASGEKAIIFFAATATANASASGAGLSGVTGSWRIELDGTIVAQGDFAQAASTDGTSADTPISSINATLPASSGTYRIFVSADANGGSGTRSVEVSASGTIVLLKFLF